MGEDTSTLERCIRAEYVTRLVIRDCHIESCDYQGISIDQAYEWEVVNCTVRLDERASDAHSSVIQYGIVPKNAASKGRIVGCRVVGGKHGIVWSENELAGISRDVIIQGNFVVGTWHAGISTHESNTRFLIADNVLAGCMAGIDVRVWSGVVSRNMVRDIPADSSIGAGVLISDLGEDLVIAENTIDGARFGVQMSNGNLLSGAVPNRLVIRGNVIKNIGQQGIYHLSRADGERGREEGGHRPGQHDHGLRRRLHLAKWRLSSGRD